MNKKALKSNKIFSLPILSSSKEDLLAYVSRIVAKDKKRKPLFVITPNPEFIIASKNDPRFLKVLKKADLAIPDGIGLLWAQKVIKKNGFWPRFWQGLITGLKVLKGELANQKITGTDLMQDLCQMAAQNHWPVYLLGAKPGVAEKALATLRKRFPGLKGYADSGPQIKNTSETSPKAGRGVRLNVSEAMTPPRWNNWVDKINQKKPTFLFVAFGMKKQEDFICQNWPDLKVSFAMGVGGAFDFIAAKVKRAPLCWRRAGLEWLYRLINQPWRWQKQLALLKFIWLTVSS